MKKFYVILLATAVVAVLLAVAAAAALGEEEEAEFEETRDGRFLKLKKLLLGGLVASLVKTDQCTTNESPAGTGTCLLRKNCTTPSVQAGKCAAGLGVCCRVTRQGCGQTTTYNNTYWQNEGTADTGTGTCALTVNRVNNNICQLRIDFIDLELGQPDVEGNCATDTFTVTGATSTIPAICGSNAGQHIYVDVDPAGGPVTLNLNRDAASSAAATRRYNMNVQQIECNSQQRAPSGCLQYYTGTTGTVSSFNFNGVATADSTPQLANQNYGICVEPASGFCSIQWSQAADGFTVSGDPNGIDPTLVGTPAGGSSGAACTADYVLIPGGTPDTGAAADRYCGLGFPTTVTSSFQPFNLFYVTDQGETIASATASNDAFNNGFSLNYAQQAC